MRNWYVPFRHVFLRNKKICWLYGEDEINSPKISLRWASLTFLDKWSMWRTTDSGTGDAFLKSNKFQLAQLLSLTKENSNLYVTELSVKYCKVYKLDLWFSKMSMFITHHLNSKFRRKQNFSSLWMHLTSHSNLLVSGIRIMHSDGIYYMHSPLC